MLSAWQALSPKTLTDPFCEFVNPLLHQSTKVMLSACIEGCGNHEDSRATSLRTARFAQPQIPAPGGAQYGGFADVAKTAPRRAQNHRCCGRDITQRERVCGVAAAT